MVRLLKSDNINIITNLICTFFNVQKHFTQLIEVDNPKITPCIYAIWHAHQFSLFGIEDKNNTNVLISRSKDGDVIANAIQKVFGFKLVRGSKGKKGAIEATMQMIEVLKKGENCAITVDGPRGPARVAKKGVVKIAKLSGAPIVPLYWYSNNLGLLKFNTWDKFEAPLGFVNLINLYGKPIYVDDSEDGEQKALAELQASLEDLERRAPEEFNKVYRFGIWQRK